MMIQARSRQRQAMSDHLRADERIYSRWTPDAGDVRWYIPTSEGVMGPYDSKERAQAALDDLMEQFRVRKQAIAAF